MTHPQIVALGLGLVVIFAGAIVAGAVREVVSGEVSSEVQTAFLTVVTGVFVFVLGQLAQRFFIEPIREQKKVLGEVTFAVRYYGGTLNFGVGSTPQHYDTGRGPPEVRKEASETLYKLSAQVRTSLSTVPFYRVFERLRFIKKKETVEEVALELKEWALWVSIGDSSAASGHRTAVAEALAIPLA